MQNSSKNLNTVKSPEEIHQNDVFTETLNETAKKGYYLEAQKELTPKPYAERNRNLFSFSKLFATAYHFVSFILGVATVFLVSKAFYTGELTIINVLIAIIIGVLLIGLLVGLEMFKSHSATELYKASAKGETASKGAQFGLLGTFVVSVIISAVGGAFLTVEMNDKSKIIQTELATQSDSLKNMYSSQLEGYEMSINSAKTTLKKYQKGWRANNARTDLQAATEAKNNLLEKLDNRLNVETDKALQNTLNNAKEGKNTAFIVAFIVLILELITILCYRFKFIYLRNTEREGISFEVITKNSSQKVSTNEPLTEIAEILKQFLQNPTPNIQQVMPLTTASPIQKSIGFKYGQNTPNTNGTNIANDTRTANSTRNTAVVTAKKNETKIKELGNGNRECPTCQEAFVYKVWNHKFCSEKCRIKAWENKTGKTFIKGKK